MPEADVTSSPQRVLSPGKRDAIHRALLAGLLSNVGTKTDPHEYTGARGTKFAIFPGSGLFRAKPPWVMAGELVETTRLYARTCAKIQPEWIERAAQHLVKRTYSEPHWNRQTAHVVAYEKVTLYGLVIVPKRTVHYGPIDPKLSREIFINTALVEGDYDTTAPYFRENRKLLDEIETLEAKRRSRDVLVDAKVRYDFYDARIPAGITNGPAFEKWRRDAEKQNPKLLHMTRRDLMRHAAAETTQELFPDAITVGGLTVALAYHLEPGHPADGVTATIPLAALNQVPAERFEWLVPGMRREKLTALIKSLPKQLRVQFVPAPEYAEQAYQRLTKPEGSLYEALAIFLSKTKGVSVRANDFDPGSLLDHLHMNFKVVDESGKPLAAGRNLDALRKQFGVKAKETFEQSPTSTPYHRDHVTSWDFGDLPESVEVKRAGITLRGYPALVDRGTSVSLRLLDTLDAADAALHDGLRRLFMIQLREEMKYATRNLSNIEQMSLHFAPLGSWAELKEQLTIAIADRALFGDDPRPFRAKDEYVRRAEAGWKRLAAASREIGDVVAAALAAYHQVSLRLSQPVPPGWQNAVKDVREQLTHLMTKDFVSRTPLPWLKQLPRFLTAIVRRLDKRTGGGHVRDEQLRAEIEPLWRQYLQCRDKHAKTGVVDPALEHYRWMIEEFRVSQFAQELKTSIPVSAKRLEAQWALVKP
jgi:ATP-dependent helicase HrpA